MQVKGEHMPDDDDIPELNPALVTLRRVCWVFLKYAVLCFVAVVVIVGIGIGIVYISRGDEGCHPAFESAAVTTLKQYVSAQEKYHRTDYDNDGVQEYAANLTTLFDWDGPGGADPIKLVDLTAVRADYSRPELGGMSGYDGNFQPRSAYYLTELLGVVENGKVKLFHAPAGDKGSPGLESSFGLVAFPAVYQKWSEKCYVVGPDGTVYESDIKGLDFEHTAELPWYFPDVEASGSKWKMVGE